MDNTVDVTIAVDAEAAMVLESPVKRDAFGRYVSRMLRGDRVHEILAEAIAEAKKEAHANGLTDEIVDAELAAWQAESRT